MILKFIWKCKGFRITKTIWKQNKNRELTLPNSKCTTKLQKSRNHGTSIRIDIYVNGIELSPEIELSHLQSNDFSKGAKTTQKRNNSIFHRWCWDNSMFTQRRKKLDFYFRSHTKNNSEWITDLNLRIKTIKLLEENTVNLHDLLRYNTKITSTTNTKKEKPR